MSASMGERQGVRRPKGAGGYSMIELIIAIVVAVIVGAGLYAIYISQQRSSRALTSNTELQARCASALDMVKGDLLLAGYKAKLNADTPISAAGPNAITFEFYDDQALADPPYDDTTQYSKDTNVTYQLVGTELRKTTERWHKPAGAYSTPMTFSVAESIKDLVFEYLKDDNQPWCGAAGLGNCAAVVGTDTLKMIRTVRVSLRCEATQDNAIFRNPALGPAAAAKRQQLSLTAEVRPRNVAIAANPEDKNPPLAPTGLNVWDAGTCGCLNVRWNSNTESDVAGYTVFYGALASGQYSGRQRFSHQGGGTEGGTLRDLPATNEMYYITVTATDASGNQSPYATEVSANPTSSVRSPGGANDTTISPLPPSAPGSPAVSTPADNQLQVSWTKTYSDCMSAPVFGYRLYRSANPNFTPSGTAAGTGNCIADEHTLGPAATSYLDTGAVGGALAGCIPYYYQVAVVNCDPAQLSNFTDPGAGTTTNYTVAQFASVSGTPTDGTPPGEAPKPGVLLSSIPGYRRIILGLTNPSRDPQNDPDFTFTRIYFSTNGFPVLTDARDAQGYNIVNDPGGGAARLIPDGGGMVAAGGGPHTINFDSENNEVPVGGLGEPELNKDATYFFLAVAYDRCLNHSTITAQNKSTATQCNDCDAGQGCRDAPPVPENVRITEGCYGSPLKIEWDYDAANYTSNPDFQGFRVVRCQGVGCVPLDPKLGGTGTVLGGTYLAADKFFLDDSVVDGQVYNYRVYGGDCYYQRWLEGLLSGDDIAANDPSNNVSWADYSDVSLGFFDRSRVVGGDTQTTLTADIGAWDSTIPVADANRIKTRQFQINSEVIECRGQTPTSFTDCWWRGAEGTIAIEHFAGTPVLSFPPALPRAAVTGDLDLVPPTFRHDVVQVGARNTSARRLTINRLGISWGDTDSWLRSVQYGSSGTTVFEDTGSPLTHGSTGTTFDLTPFQIDGLASDQPLKLTFLKQDGTLDPSVDLREDQLDLTWYYTNNATACTDCTRQWWPPPSPGIDVPLGPTVGGTTQSAPTWGTTAWPVPGATANPLDAVIAPSQSQNWVTTNVHDNSGNGINSVWLYYATTDKTATAPPAVTGAYPECAPYTAVKMQNFGFSDTWGASFPPWSDVALLDDKRVWYFIVARDNEGNFDREPEADQGAFEYFQQPPDPCLNTPQDPQLTVTMTSPTQVHLDWSASWWGGIYHNDNGTQCTDLAGFRVFTEMGNRGWHELTPVASPLSPTTTGYDQTFTVATATLTGPVDAGDATLPVGSTTGFLAVGKVRIGGHVVTYAAKTATSFTGCTWGPGATGYTALAGTSLSQNNLDLEVNRYYVSAFDTCSSGAKHSESPVVAEGSCTPSCSLQTWPNSPTTLQAGQDFYVYLQACEFAGNGTSDTIYVHACSSQEGDDVALQESGDYGWFYATVGTRQLAGQGGGNAVLYVGATDTISIGGYATASNSWVSMNNCSLDNYPCGQTQTISVAPALSDPCSIAHVPDSVQGTPVSARVGTDTCSGNLTRQTLTWNAVTFPTECTSRRYRVYYTVKDNHGVWSAYQVANFASAPSCGGTTCTSTLSPTPSKINGNDYRFAVTAVCEMNTCVQTWDGQPYTTSWESLNMSSDTADACP